MSLIFADRVRELSITTGIGTLDLDGASTGFITFVSGIGTTNTCHYCITDNIDWEIGIGTVVAGTASPVTVDTLSRDTILSSSNAGSAVNWGAGTRYVFVTDSAARITDPSPGISDNADTVAITIDANKNVGLGVSTLDLWSSTWSVLQVGGNSSLAGDTTADTSKSLRLSQNAYNDGAWKYRLADEATNYYQNNGSHVFQTAATGVADDPITWSPALTLSKDGAASIAGSISNISHEIYLASALVAQATDVDVEWRESTITLEDTYRYTFRLTTLGTGVEAGATYIVWYDGSSSLWQSRLVSRAGSSSNHPLLKIDSGNTKAQMYHNHTASYSILVNTEVRKTGTPYSAPQFFGSDYMWQRDFNDLYYNDGNVGVGTTNPPDTLSIDGTNASIGAAITTLGGGDIYPTFQILPFSHDNISLSFDAAYTSGWISSDVGSNFQIVKVSNTLNFNYESGVAVGSGITWTAAMTIASSGAVGIGTGTGAIDGQFHVQSGSAGTVAASTVANTGVFEHSATGGISILTPNGSSSVVMFGSPANNRGSEIVWRQTTSTMSLLTRQTGGLITFSTANAVEAVRIGTNQNFSIGTTSTVRRLNVVTGSVGNYVAALTHNTSSAASAWGQLIDFSASSPNNVSNAFIRMEDSTALKCAIYSNGDIKNVNGTYTTISDIKMKDNIVDTNPKLADIMKLRVVNYNLKKEINVKQPRHIGFVAQDMEKVFPGLVDETNIARTDKKPKMMKGVKTSLLTPMLVKAVQELNQKVEDQAAIISTMEARLSALEAK